MFNDGMEVVLIAECVLGLEHVMRVYAPFRDTCSTLLKYDG